MNRNTILIDLGFAVLIAAAVLILSPGVAVAGMLALLLLIVCAVSIRLDSRRARRARPARPAPRTRRPPR